MKRFTIDISIALALGLSAIATLALLWLLTGSPQVARAADLTVCPTGPPTCDYGTIQAAVDAANDGDVVKVATGVYIGVSAREGVTQVVYVSKTVTIRGGYTTAFTDPPDPDANPTTLDVQGQGRVLYITGDISPTVEGLRITGGDAAGLDGNGGGVYIINAAATISNNSVFSNTAANGGSLYLYGSAAMLSGNTIISNTAGSGGGLYLDSSDATLISNTVTANTASGTGVFDGGGGLYLYRSAATLNGNIVTSNTANATDYRAGGGGLQLRESAATLSDNTISFNATYGSGGGLHLDHSNATLSDNTVTSNTTSGRGGGLCLRSSDATLNDNAVISNTASDSGGGLSLNSSPATLSGNIVTSNTASTGGGLSLLYSPATLSGNIVTSNTANGTDMFPGEGGGLSLRGSDATLSGNTITANTTNGGGGGLYLYNSDATLTGNTITVNTAGWGGGGLYLFTSATTLSGNAIISNAARDGGGLYLDSSADTLSGNIITSNTANSGGGLYLYWSGATLSGNTVTANTANSGGGLYLRQSGDTLTNNIVADNQANSLGSGLYIWGSSPRLLHTTIARNSGGDGSGVYVTNFYFGYSTVALTNTILVSHTVGVTVTAGNTATLEATLWGSGAWANDLDWGGGGTVITGTVNLWGDPTFLNPYYGDYHIGSDSAAVDAGVDAGVLTDIDGEPRPMDGGYDIGADEVPLTNSTPTLSGLPDQIFDHGTLRLPGTIDLWAYAWDAQTPVSALTYAISGTPPSGAGVSLTDDRTVTVNPSTDWCGYVDVTVRATDPGGLWDSDTFRVAVTWSCQGPLEVPDQAAGHGESITLDLTDYEPQVGDGTGLLWYVTGEDHCTVSGEYSADDVLTFTPEAGFVGGDTVTLHMVYPWEDEATQALTLTWGNAETSAPMFQIYLPVVMRDF